MPFVEFQEAPGDSIEGYDRSKASNEQKPGIPKVFKQAMEVREKVFVQEQKVPLENELDEDDARSHHWVVCALGDLNAPPRVPADPETGLPPLPEGRRKSSSVASAKQIPIGTVRLVPPPHPPHEHPAIQPAVDNAGSLATIHEEHEEVPSIHNPRNEPYIKIGRLAVLPEFRSQGTAKLLLDTALQWASENPKALRSKLTPLQKEEARYKGGAEGPLVLEWDGLVLVHAQKYLEKLYRHWGFKTDEAMGTWVEEGIEHVGMWRRIPFAKEPLLGEYQTRRN